MVGIVTHPVYCLAFAVGKGRGCVVYVERAPRGRRCGVCSCSAVGPVVGQGGPVGWVVAAQAIMMAGRRSGPRAVFSTRTGC